MVTASGGAAKPDRLDRRGEPPGTGPDAGAKARLGSELRARVEAIELPLDRELHADLHFALGYWRRKKGERVAPGRADIDPLDIAPILPRVMLVDVIGDPVEFRYRLAGTGIVTIHGTELTNTRARDLEPAVFGETIHRHYVEALARRAPIAHRLLLDVESLRSTYLRIILPLSDDGQAINRLMTVECYPESAQDLRSCFDEVRSRAGSPR